LFALWQCVTKDSLTPTHFTDLTLFLVSYHVSFIINDGFSLVKGINKFAVPVIQYIAPLLDWSVTGLNH